MRAGIAIVTLALTACGGGSGEGLCPDGQPIPPGGCPAPLALAPTLASIQVNVFSPSCAVSGCHGGANAQQGLRLDPGFSYSNLINVVSPQSPQGTTLIRVIPGDADGSFLIHKLEGTQTVGDPMPQFGQPLPRATRDVIRQWIQNGAPE